MQRSSWFRLFNVLLAALVLSTSTGFGVREHACLMRGQKTYSLSPTEAKPCPGCPEQKTPAKKPGVQKEACCQDRSTYQHVSFTESLVQWVAKVLKATAQALVNACVWVLNGLAAGLLSLLSQAASTTPAAVPLSGRSLLQFVQSFLI